MNTDFEAFSDSFPIFLSGNSGNLSAQINPRSGQDKPRMARISRMEHTSINPGPICPCHDLNAIRPPVSLAAEQDAQKSPHPIPAFQNSISLTLNLRLIWMDYQSTKDRFMSSFKSISLFDLPVICIFRARKCNPSLRQFSVMVTTIMIALLTCPSIRAQASDYRFSQNFSTAELLTNSIRRAEFTHDLMVSLGKGFHQPDVAYHPTLATTFDGARFDFFSGRPFGVRKNVTVGSKEAIHLSILSACVAGNHLARLFVSPDNTNSAPSIATNLLTRKLDAWDDFDRRYPGFGRWLPWMSYKDDRLVPAENPDKADSTWTNRVPALDNGEFVVALLQFNGDLRDAGYASLADRLWQRIEYMRSNAVTMFIQPGTNLVRGVVRIAHPELPPTHLSQVYSNEDYFSNDACEGELMALFLDLFGYWPVSGDSQSLWKKHRIALNYTMGGSNIVVQQGYRFSSHEEWGFLQWPYLDTPSASAVFHNNQVARTHFSSVNGIPGLLAACHKPLIGNGELVYEDKPGIPSLALPTNMTATITNLVTAYAAFPVILADQAIGLAWLDQMLDAPKGQTMLGIADSLAADGSAVAPVVTWDVNGLVALALITESRIAQTGEHPLRKHLIRMAVFDRASMIISNEYTEAFGSLSATTIPMALPAVQVPRLLPDFPATSPPPPGNVLAGTPFKGNVSNSFTFTNGVLTLFPSNGFNYAECERFRLQTLPILELRARGSGRFNLELKNPADQLIAPKFNVSLSNTSDAFQTFHAVLPTNVFKAAEEIALITLSDPNATLSFASFRFVGTAPTNTQLLQWDGVGFVKDPEAPVDLLGPGTVFMGNPTNNALAASYCYSNGILSLPPVPGYIFEFSPLVSLTTKPVLTLKAKSRGTHVFVEVKNTRDLLMTPQKVLVEIPDTSDQFQDFSMDFSQVIESTNSTLFVFVFSDPIGSTLQISNISFSPHIPQESTPLIWSGRRFARLVSPQLPPTPFLDLLKYLNFISQPLDAGFQFIQDDDITVHSGSGFAFTTMPSQVKGQPLAFTLAEKPVFCMIASTFAPDSSIQLELKNCDNKSLFGDTNGIYPKIQLTITQSTDGLPRLLAFDLSRYTNSHVGPGQLSVIAFSDPNALFRIAGLGFLSSIPAESPSVRVGSRSTNPWVTWYGGSLQESATILGPWKTESNAVSPWFPSNATPAHFWRVKRP